MTVNMGQRTPDTPGPVVPFFYPCVARPETATVAHKKGRRGAGQLGKIMARVEPAPGGRSFCPGLSITVSA